MIKFKLFIFGKNSTKGYDSKKRKATNGKYMRLLYLNAGDVSFDYLFTWCLNLIPPRDKTDNNLTREN